jgi:2-keto-3-deoxy-L-rhamnonate aldolase RhmA
MVGAGDLRCSLGLEVGSQDGDEPEFLEALEKIQRAADANGLAVLGFAMTPEILRRRLERGWRALIIHADGYGIFKSGTDSLKASLETAKNIKPAKAAPRNGVNGAASVER